MGLHQRSNNKIYTPCVSLHSGMFLTCHYLDFKLRFIITFIISISLSVLIVYKFTLNSLERSKVDKIMNSIKNKISIIS